MRKISNRVWFSGCIALLLAILMLGAASPTPSLSPKAQEIAALTTEFVRAQRSELKALEHRCKFEIKELKSSQDVRQREWRTTETEARHRFFEVHPKGAERRVYIRDFMKRRDAFNQGLADEKARLVKDQEARVTALKAEHGSQLRKFSETLKKGETPSSDLWPKPGT